MDDTQLYPPVTHGMMTHERQSPLHSFVICLVFVFISQRQTTMQAVIGVNVRSNACWSQ